MAQEDTLAAEEPPAPSPRVEGWVGYYQYFHALNEDMQRLSEVSTQRRSWSGSVANMPPFPKRESSCFEAIATAIKQQDKPLVHIHDPEKPGERPQEPPKGGRTLTESDLTLVRAQLRAAARATSPAAAAEEQQRFASAADSHGASGRHGARKALAGQRTDDTSDPNTCAAAIETLLWFGLALGDQKERKEKQRAEEQALSGALEAWAAGMDGEEEDALDLAEADEGSQPLGAVGDLSSWDWEQAMREAGIDDEDPSSADDEVRREAADGEEPSAERSAEQSPTPPTPVTCGATPRRVPAAWGAGAEGKSAEHERPPPLQQFASEASVGTASVSSTAPSERAPSEGDSDETQEHACDESGAMSGEGEGEECEVDGTDSGRTTPRIGLYASPSSPPSPEAASNEDRQAKRRSTRQPKPQRPWLSSVAAPLLKWEKEQQEKPNRPKRRSGGSGMLYETDSGEELVASLISGGNGLLAESTTDSVLDLVFGRAQLEEGKRQRVLA